jgi:outer membrane immunogenic protein
MTGSALAADLPHYKAPPPPPPPPPPMWTGFYVGLNAGGTWAQSNSTNTTAFPIFAAPAIQSEANVAALLATSNIGSGNGGGFIGGGQIGYNWQFYNSFVAGIEADIQGIAYSNNTRNFAAVSGVPGFPLETMFGAVSVKRNVDYIGTVRGRLGWLFTPTLLVYGTGGLAYGGVSSSTSMFQTDTLATTGCTFCNPYFTAGSYSDTRVGWTAGGGLEWMFWPNWSAKVEYLYYDLGRVSYAMSPLVSFFNGGAPAWAAIAQSSTRFNGNIVRAGVNYHFNWGAAPVVAKY